MPHYYDRETGLLLPQVQIKSGESKGFYRDADLRDARKVNALISPTTVLQLLAKPGLVKWQVEQGIKAALTHDMGEYPEQWGELIPAIYQKSLDYTHWTQDFGTAVHWWVNYKLRDMHSTEVPPMIPLAEEVAQGFLDWADANGYVWELTEHRVFRPDLGYAGTLDLLGTHYGQPCIGDLKTQENDPSFHVPEYPLQLAAYDYALGECCIHCGLPEDSNHDDKDHYEVTISGYPRERISLIADRNNPGTVYEKLWVDKGSDIATTNQRYDNMWISMLHLWMQVHQYDPRKEAEDESG